MFKSFAMAAMGVLASAAFSSSAFAGLITWDLHQQIAPNSHEQTISSTNGFLNLTYSAWSSTNSGASYDPAQLTDNSAGTGVLGGAFNGIDNDGASGSHIEYVAIEVPSGGWLDVTLTTNQVNPGDQFVVFGSDAADIDSATVLTNLFPGALTDTGSQLDQYAVNTQNFAYMLIGITGNQPAAQFRIYQIDANVPEPGTLLLLGAGLAGLGIAGRKRRQKV